jgi:hypothetical protein
MLTHPIKAPLGIWRPSLNVKDSVAYRLGVTETNQHILHFYGEYPELETADLLASGWFIR